MESIAINPENLPASRRLKVGKKYLILSQPGVKVPLVWYPDEIPEFIQFLDLWYKRGYYDAFGVSISTGKNTASFIEIFDWVAEKFKCRYNIQQNKVVTFCSAILKYTMLGLGFKDGLKKDREPPLWFVSYKT